MVIERARSAVGAGDALLSGFLAGGASGEPALRTALTWAATALQQPGTLLGPSADEDAFQLLFHDRPQLLRQLRAD